MYRVSRLTYKEYGKRTVPHDKLDGEVVYDVYESEEEYEAEMKKQKEIEDSFDILKNMLKNV